MINRAEETDLSCTSPKGVRNMVSHHSSSRMQRASKRLQQVAVAAAAIAVFVAIPIAATAQHTTMIPEAIANREVREAVYTLLNDARAKGIPEEPLIAKVREGIAKQSDPALIGSAVATLLVRLERAQKALAPVYNTEELAAGAGALAVSVPDEMLRNMRRSWPSKPLTVPIGVLTELVANGIPAASAAGRINALLERGASSAQIVALGDTVRSDVAAGRPADASMALRTKGILTLLTSTGAAVPAAGTTDLTQSRERGRRPPS